MSSILSKITSHAKNQENETCNQEKYHSIEIYTEIPEMTKFTDIDV